jgi:hypothetical protein
MTATMTNGQQRKTLASQLDRLDAIIDTLGEGLSGAVSGAVEQAVESAVRHAVSLAVKEATQAILGEILVNPDLRAALAPPSPPVEDHDTMPPRGGLTQTASRTWGWMKGRIGAGLRLARKGASAAWQRVADLGPVKGALAVVTGMGALAATIYFGGPFVATGCGCLAGLVVTQAARTRETLRRLLVSFTPASD